MEANQMEVGLKVRSETHPEDIGEIVRLVFKGKAGIVRWNGEDEEHPALASLLTADEES